MANKIPSRPFSPFLKPKWFDISMAIGTSNTTLPVAEGIIKPKKTPPTTSETINF